MKPGILLWDQEHCNFGLLVTNSLLYIFFPTWEDPLRDLLLDSPLDIRYYYTDFFEEDE